MDLHVRRSGAADGPSIVLVAGFGDHGGMFDALAETMLGAHFGLVAVDLPGTGRSAPIAGRLTLDAAAGFVAEVVAKVEATTIVGHSVGSIVASLAASRPGSTIGTIISLEGNLTLDDAYFSGSAAQYDSATAFHRSFLERLDAMAADDEILARYRDQVALADAQSIWELGCDTDAWSRANDPGALLLGSAPRVHYLYNPANTPDSSLDWIARHDLDATTLDGASHWATIDQPDIVASIVLDVISG